MIRLMIVDDHALVRAGLNAIIQNDRGIKVVAQASTAAEALQAARTETIDVLLLDLELQGVSGLYVTRKWSTIQASTKILILTSTVSTFFPYRLFSAGDCGYLNKTTKPQELCTAIHTLHQGGRVVEEKLANRLAFAVMNPEPLSAFSVLSDSVLEIAGLTVRGYKPSRIAQMMHLSVATVHVYRHTMFNQLGIRNDIGLTRLAIKEGILAPDLVDASV